MDKLTENIVNHLHEICLKPSRHVGSAGEMETIDYIADSFRRYGYDNVVKEPFSTTGWHFDHIIFADLDNNCIPVPGALACFFSQSCNVSGVPVWLTEENIKSVTAEDVRGKLCMVEFFSDAADIRGRNGIAEDLDRLGAAAAVFVSDSAYHTTCAPSSKIQRSPFLKTLGTAVVGEEGAYYLSRNRNHHYKLIIKAHTFEHTSYNVVAIRPGTGSKRAVIGAHFDAAPFGQAASDNASGTAMLLELSRLLKDKFPEWTFEFAAFDAEEYCIGYFPVGSKSYVDLHSDRKWEFYLNFDSIAIAFSHPSLHVGYKEKLKDFNTACRLLPIKLGGDDRSFNELGVPTLWYGSNNIVFQDFHTPCDTIATLDIPRFKFIAEDALQLLEALCN